MGGVRRPLRSAGPARPVRVLTAVLCSAGLLAAGAGAASADTSMDGPAPRECVPPVGTNQIILPLPGLFLPLPSVRGLDEFGDLAPAEDGVDLPERVALRDEDQGFNGYAEFALRDGSLYTRPQDSGAPWRKAPTPECLDGAVTAISVDSNMVVALDDQGWIYSLDNVLSGPMLWNWTRSFGAPIWLWPGMQVPDGADAPGRWAISHRISESFTDAEDHEHPTTAGLVQLVALAGDGSRIVYQDPWLAADHSYEIGGPEDGRLISEAVSGSGSVTFVMNRHGDMYTRAYDLDMAGANHIPGRYTWQEQGDEPPAPDQLAERFDPQYAAISLPAEDWRHQPKIPGEVTARISIHQTGPTVEDRELRVEGRRDGDDGYWHKPIAAGEWEFTATGEPLQRPLLDADPTRDQSGLTLAPPTGLDFQGALPDGWTARLTDFDWAQTTRDVTLTSPAGHEYTARLHTTDALRLIPRDGGPGPALDGEPRNLEGALDVRDAQPWAPGNDELADFVRTHMEGRDVFEVGVEAAADHVAIAPVGLLPEPLGVLGRE